MTSQLAREKRQSNYPSKKLRTSRSSPIPGPSFLASGSRFCRSLSYRTTSMYLACGHPLFLFLLTRDGISQEFFDLFDNLHSYEREGLMNRK